MKTLLIAIAAIGLIVVGAVGENAVRPLFDHQAAAAPTRTAQSSPVNRTTSFQKTASNAPVTSIDAATEHAYTVASPSVVYVDNLSSGTGSGIVYDAKGDIVTNAHVVDGTKTQRVTLSDGRTFTAHTVGTDSADDLAVIRIHASGLTPAQFASAGSFRVAQTVLAIGSPLGLKNSVTSGLISGLGRVEQEPNGAYLPNAVQTSAPINPGNSGGALVTLDGAVVGMPTLEQTSTQNGTSTQSIGFAVPSTRITYVANQIISTGKVEHTGRAFLGISPADSTAQSSGGFGFGFGFGQGGNGSQRPVTGAVVQQVESNGPSGRAGVQQGDVITAIDGARVANAQDLLAALAQDKPGQTVALKLNRSGNVVTVHVKLGEMPA